MEEHTILMDSWRTSDSTITLREFRLLGIHDGYKYVPKAHEIEPPFLREVKLPGRNMNLTIVTDSQLFTEYWKGVDPEVEQMKSQKKEQEIVSTGSSDSSSTSDDTSSEDISLKSNSDCESTECNPDKESQEDPQVEHNPDIQSRSLAEFITDARNYTLDTSSSSGPEDTSMADISMKNDSDCDSMECNPDTEPQEVPEVEFSSLPDIQSRSLGEYFTDVQNHGLDEYNPWQPEM